MPRLKNDPELLKTVGESLRLAREARSVTQARLAELIGIEVETLSRYETGASSPSLTTLHRGARSLGLSLPELLEASAVDPSADALGAELERVAGLLQVMDPSRRSLAIALLEVMATK